MRLLSESLVYHVIMLCFFYQATVVTLIKVPLDIITTGTEVYNGKVNLYVTLWENRYVVPKLELHLI